MALTLREELLARVIALEKNITEEQACELVSSMSTEEKQRYYDEIDEKARHERLCSSTQKPQLSDSSWLHHFRTHRTVQ